MKFISICRIIFLLGISLLTISCTHAKTWELENLKKPKMSLTQDSIDTKVPDHIDRSKEAASSVSVDGNGCSCY